MRWLGMAAVSVCAAAALGGCKHMPVQQGDLQARRVSDSTMIAVLQKQLVELTLRCRADSMRYAALAARQVPVAPAVGGTGGAADSVLRARDEEIAALKDQLVKAQDELERIKRRLASPRP